MHRGFKLCLYGLVLAGVVGGTAAWAGSEKSVSLKIDGQQRRVHTTASTVRGVLTAAHVSVGSHDLVAPDPDSPIHDGSQIVIDRGHLLRLTVDGVSRDVWVTADSVQQALAQLGYGSAQLVSVSRSKRLGDGVTDISIGSPKLVLLKVDGNTVAVTTAGPTVLQAIIDSGIAIGPHDRLSAPRYSTIRDNEVVTIQRVSYRGSVEQVSVPYGVDRIADPNSYVGTSSVARPGRNGVSRVIYQLVYVDGKLAGKVRASVQVVSRPVNEQDRIGTKQVTGVSPGDAQQLAAGMVADRGWGNGEFSCLLSLWNKESGWRTDAANPSGAYGIPQALPGSKMASAGPDWEHNAATQISWGLGYIASVYGTPCTAWAHSQATNWY
ncbi:MAG: ubiquitin-like domain-containing protein [Jatrophihabitantaceae bacterium]